jgi:DNA-directed RNA polymerase specialized sigma24 family protein
MNPPMAPEVHTRRYMHRSIYAEAFQTGFGATRRFLISRGAPLDEAEEIAQAAWVRGWENREQLRDPELVNYWVNSIARNLFRAKFRTRITLRLEDTPEPSYAFDMESIELNQLLGMCQDGDRAMLEESLEGYSAEEMARGSGISSTGMRVRLLRVRQALRRKIAVS